MERNLNAKANSQAFFNEVFNCNKMKSLIADEHTENFTDRFRNWLKTQLKGNKEKVWVDIESYNAG